MNNETKVKKVSKNGNKPVIVAEAKMVSQSIYCNPEYEYARDIVNHLQTDIVFVQDGDVKYKHVKIHATNFRQYTIIYDTEFLSKPYEFLVEYEINTIDIYSLPDSIKEFLNAIQLYSCIDTVQVDNDRNNNYYCFLYSGRELFHPTFDLLANWKLTNKDKYFFYKLEIINNQLCFVISI